MTVPGATVVEEVGANCQIGNSGAAVTGASDESWVAVPDAARIAGAGLRTVRRWIAQGEVNSRLVEVNGHPVRQVEVASLMARGSASGQGATEKMAAGSAGGSANLECRCCRVWERQCGTLEEQLHLQTQNATELRVILARLERTNAELAGALVMKALPPAGVTGSKTEPVKRVRWWCWWR